MTKKQTKAAAKKQPQEKPAVEKSFDFDVERFSTAKFGDRFAEIPVTNSDMLAFYPEGTTPMLQVRGLTAQELAVADQETQINREARAEGMLGQIGEEAIEALRVLLRTHLGGDVPDQHVKMLHIVHLGLVKPKLEYDQVIKFADAFPVEFRTVFMKINELTGRGKDYLGKPKPSGATQR
jgi:hypothetical protein